MTNQVKVDYAVVRGEISASLKGGICIVVFKKTDGSERTMRCTLRQDLLPVKPVKADDDGTSTKSTNPPKKKTDNNISVWDLDKSAWRSFNVTSLIKWKRES